MKKKINFKPAAEVRATVERDIDQWVKTGTSSPGDAEKAISAILSDSEEKEELYRLSLDIPKYLHRRIKKTCAAEGFSIKERLTEILLKSFPEK
jgi:hypothetical protein